MAANAKESEEKTRAIKEVYTHKCLYVQYHLALCYRTKRQF